MQRLETLPTLKTTLSQARIKTEKAERIWADIAHQGRLHSKPEFLPARGIGLNRWYPSWELGAQATAFIERRGRLLGQDDTGLVSVMIFRDLVVSVRREPKTAELRFVKVAEPEDMHRDLPALATLAGDEWLHQNEVKRRSSPPTDEVETLLLRRVHDIVAIVPPGTVGKIEFSRDIYRPGNSYLNLYEHDYSEYYSFVISAIKYVILQAGVADQWCRTYESAHPSLASSWKRRPVHLEVKSFVQPSATLRLTSFSAALSRTQAWLLETDVGTALLQEFDLLRQRGQ